MKRFLSLLGCIMLLATSVQAMEISVTPLYWAPDLHAYARIEKDHVGDEIDFDRDLGMDDEDVFGGTVDITFGRSNHFILSYWTTGYDGNKVLERTFDYNGATYDAGDRVKSSFDLDVWEFGYAFDLLNFETFRAGFMLNVNYYGIDTALDTVPFDSVKSREENMDLVFPVPGIRVAMLFMDKKLEVSGQFGGLWWQGSGWWDTSGQLSYHPMENAAISVGYRAIHIDASDDDDSINLKLDGLTASATIRF
jgi:opacity protein-like surface antigen